MATIFDRNQPVLLQPANETEESAKQAPEWMAPKPSRFSGAAIIFAAILAVFWAGVWGAFLWGYLGPKGFAALELQQAALFGAAILLPPFFFVAIAAMLARATKMEQTAQAMMISAERLFAVDESVPRTAARMGRAVRRELDALNAGLDGAFARLRALETSLENQIAALDEASARAEVRSEAIAARLTQESQRLDGVSDHLAEAAARVGETVAGRTAQLKATIETAEGSLKMAAQSLDVQAASFRTQESQRLDGISDHLAEAAARAGETVAGRAAQLKATIEAAEGSLKMAAQSLDVQAASFRAAANAAAESPHAAAVELDSQAKKIETVSDAALARAEFVLARQEKHRTAMGDLLIKLKDDSAQFESALSQQRAGMEQAIGVLGGEAKRFELVTGDAERHLELIMANAVTRASQLTSAFSREAERLKEASDAANTVLNALTIALRDAGSGAQTLIGESTAQAKQDARALVGEAMAECERLLRAAGEMNAEANQIRSTLAKAVEDVEYHLTRLPAVAQGEAQRIRQMVQSETDQMLDLSARTISTIHQRGAQGRAAPSGPAAEPSEGDGLKGLARKLTQRPKKSADLRGEKGDSNGKNWEMKTLLAAVETQEIQQSLSPASAATLGALEVALTDMAVDLDAISADTGPGNEEWKRYLSGDRSLFARKLAAVIDDTAMNRITALYRDDERFHDAADAYLSEFEALLARAREGDGGGLLTSTILSADTGKIYLAIAYALGRL